MARHCHTRLAVALLCLHPVVEGHYTGVGAAASMHESGVAGLHEGPLEIAVEGSAPAPAAMLAPTGVSGEHGATVGGEPAGGGEARDVSDLSQDHHREGGTDARQRAQQLDVAALVVDLGDAGLESIDRLLESIQMLQQARADGGGVGGKLAQDFLESLPASYAKEIAEPTRAEAVLGQRRMEAVLDLGALAQKSIAAADSRWTKALVVL